MIILGLPLMAWLGILTFCSLVTTVSLGVAMHVYKKNVFKYHRFFAITTITIAMAHVTLTTLFVFFGIYI